MSSQAASNAKPKAAIIVDPISTGANMAHIMLENGKTIIAVWSNKVSDITMKLLMPGLRSDYYASHRFDYANPQRSIDYLNALPVTITSILAGSELGVELTDELAEFLNLPGNGTSLTDARREKYLMGETLREYAKQLEETTGEKIRSVKQHRAESFGDEPTQTFIQEFFSNDSLGNPVDNCLVVKPARSSGSDDVFLCRTPEEIKEKMTFILGRPNKLGIMNTCVLLQEYLEGDEYVIDTVSKDGVHKLAGCWRYLKGVANDAQFVYHGMVIVDGAGELGRRVFEYTKHVLDALNIRNGCAHAEVMLSPTKGPCLVEVGARLHGGEGIFMNVARKCVGYSQVDVAAAFLGSEHEFAGVPALWKLKPGCYGGAIDMISFREGKLAGYSPEIVEAIRNLPCFLSFNCMPKVGDTIEKTVDCFTTVGSISIALTPEKALDEGSDVAHEASEQAKRDIMHAVSQIRAFERQLFILEGDNLATDSIRCVPTTDILSSNSGQHIPATLTVNSPLLPSMCSEQGVGSIGITSPFVTTSEDATASAQE